MESFIQPIAEGVEVDVAEGQQRIDVIRVAMFPSHSKKTLPACKLFFFLFASATRAMFLTKPDVDRLHFSPIDDWLAAWLAASRFQVPLCLRRAICGRRRRSLSVIFRILCSESAFVMEGSLSPRAAL